MSRDIDLMGMEGGCFRHKVLLDQIRAEVVIIRVSDPFDMADLAAEVAVVRESGKACLVVKEGATQAEIDERLNEILHEVKAPPITDIEWLKADQLAELPFIPRETPYERAHKSAPWYSKAKGRRKW